MLRSEATLDGRPSSLYWAGTIAIMLIIAALLLKFRLGLWFDIGMISLAGLSILYDTSKIMKYYRSNKYVANALSLFASICESWILD